MKRSNQYEAAFEAYLQSYGYPYVAVDETRRSLVDGERIKSLDFIVQTAEGLGLLVDVKGRRFPGGPPGRPRRVWECWSTEEDVHGLRRWKDHFGPGFRGLLVFAFDVVPDEPLLEGSEELWSWEGRRYLLRACNIDDYAARMRVRSPRWGTVCLPSDVFRTLAQPFRHFTQLEPPLMEEIPF